MTEFDERSWSEAIDIYERRATVPDESDYAPAVAELGMEVDPPPPYSPGGWLALVAGRLSAPRADYGTGTPTDAP